MISVRLATLADAVAITDLHKSDIARWERIGPRGETIPVRYEDLTLYERWQHGGPWLSIESCAVHLNHLLAGVGFPLVAELDGQVLAEAEVYESFEPRPFGHHLDLALIATHTEATHQGLGTALIKYIIEMARLMKCERVTVSHAEASDFYAKHGFKHTLTGCGVRIPSQPGRVFYQSTELTDRDPNQIKGWHMLLGRYQSSRQEWDKLFPQDWAAGIPEILSIRTAHVKLTVTGQNAILFVQDVDVPGSQPGDGALSCWSARPLSNPLFTAIRDWGARNGFPALSSYMMEHDLPLLGNDAQQTDYAQEVYELPL